MLHWCLQAFHGNRLMYYHLVIATEKRTQNKAVSGTVENC